jgi:hypothetical protein
VPLRAFSLVAFRTASLVPLLGATALSALARCCSYVNALQEKREGRRVSYREERGSQEERSNKGHAQIGLEKN